MISKIRAAKKLLLKEKSFIIRSGWYRSFQEGRPVNAKGEFLPWMNYAIIDFLEERLSSDMTVFEYGSGYSTMFYAKHTAAIQSVETDESWAQKVQELAPKNASISGFSEDDLPSSINRFPGLFDLIVVDSVNREECTKAAVDKLSDGGVVLLDDSQRPKYKGIFDFLASNNFKFITFYGLKPSDQNPHKTTVFYRANNCFNI